MLIGKEMEDIERRIEDIEKDVAVLCTGSGIRTAVEAYPEESTSTSSAYGQERADKSEARLPASSITAS